jgi:hypothetical protein
MRSLLFLLLVFLMGPACDESTSAPCVAATFDPACTASYEPTYDNVFANTLKPSCAKSGVSCHASTGRQGGLNFDDAEGAYTALKRRAVVPGQPGCSDLVRRIGSRDGNVRMPPGRSLPDDEQCSIVRWIERGALR